MCNWKHLQLTTNHARAMLSVLTAQLMLIHLWCHISYWRITLLSSKDTSGRWSKNFTTGGVFIYKCVANNSLGTGQSESVTISVDGNFVSIFWFCLIIMQLIFPLYFKCFFVWKKESLLLFWYKISVATDCGWQSAIITLNKMGNHAYAHHKYLKYFITHLSA